ncbi:MAG: hypothetical protein KJP21_09190 [Bacteroidia bacterium]|nr:hypothetical protein [Bacteroidia bacterium]
MSKTKFRFNTETLEYERVSTNYWAVASKVLAFVSLAVIIGVASVMYAVDGETADQLKSEIAEYQTQLKILEKRP